MPVSLVLTFPGAQSILSHLIITYKPFHINHTELPPLETTTKDLCLHILGAFTFHITQ